MLRIIIILSLINVEGLKLTFFYVEVMPVIAEYFFLFIH